MVLRLLQRLPRERGEALARLAGEHPSAVEGIAYEPWYLQRWHCLPEGYLSERSARWWDGGMRRLYTCGRERQVAAILSARLRTLGASKVADIGAGGGSLGARVAAQTPGLHVTAFDLSPYFVSLAARRLGADNALHADARDVPAEPGSFDAAIASHLLGHVPPAVSESIAAEVARVLAPGGRLFTAEHRWHRLRVSGFVQVGEWRSAGGVVLVREFAHSAT